MLVLGRRYIGRNFRGYKILRLLGQGRYGACFEAMAPDGSSVVLKRFHNRMRRRNQKKNHFEPVILSVLDHDSVPSLLGVINAGKDYFFILEKMPGVSIETMLFKEHYIFSQSEFYRIGNQLIDIIAYLHDKNIVHRDIRAANVLWDHQKVSLIDFGLARFQEKNKYPPETDFSYLGDFLLYLLYSSFQGSTSKSRPWYEELSLSALQKCFLKRLLGIDPPYQDMIQIKEDFSSAFCI